jgi:hypothetical protein
MAGGVRPGAPGVHRDGRRIQEYTKKKAKFPVLRVVQDVA